MSGTFNRLVPPVVSRSRTPVWPRFVYTLDMSLRTAQAKRKLRDSHAAPAQQDAAFRSLTQQLAHTSHWKQHGIEPGISYAQFQTRVPLHSYSEIAPAVELMKEGKKNVLWPGDCTLFGQTAGTSSGNSKCLPMPDELLGHFRRAGFQALLHYTARVRDSCVFKGRHLYYGGSSTLTSLTHAASRPAFVGEVTGIAPLSFPPWVVRYLYEPGGEIARVSTFDAQTEAIARTTASHDITLIAGIPNSVAALISALRSSLGAERGGLSLQERWRNLECFIHTGASLAPYATELKLALGTKVNFHEVYAASEGVVAVQDAEPGQGLRVLADMGIFFEFVSVADFDDFRLDQLGPKTVPLSGVKTNVDYVILLTTPGGLARYVLGDVVRFTSVAPPRLIHVGGTDLRLNAFRENVTERDVTSAIVELCERRGWTLMNFHVAPLFAPTSMTGQRRGRHEWWIELKPGSAVTPTGPRMAVELDESLRAASARYASQRRSAAIDTPVVRLVMPGVFEQWLRHHQKWGGQHKMPRCRSDRQVADEFAQMTNFARD